MRGKRHFATLIAAGLAGFWGASLAFSHWRGGISFLDRIEGTLTDLRFLIQGERPAPDTVTIVAIDDETVQEAGSYPLPRITVAKLLDGIGRHNPKVVAIDILFVDAGPQDGDEALARSLEKTPSVLAAAGTFERAVQTLSFSDGNDLASVPVAKDLLVPVSSLGMRAALGVVNVTTDPSGTPRHIPLLLRSDGQLVPSFPLRAASVAIAQDPVLDRGLIMLGPVRIGTDLGYALPLRFYGPRGAIRTISAIEVLRNRPNAEDIRDRIVVVGGIVTGGGDVFPTPFDPVLPGVEVMATAIAHLTTGDGLIRDRRVRMADAAVAVLLPILLVLLLAWHRSSLGFALIGTVALLWIGATAIAFSHGIWLSATLPLAAAAPPATLFGAARLWLDRRRAEKFAAESSTLRQFQPPRLAARLAQDPGFLTQPVRQKAALVFIDLSGFTGLSEDLSPDETREIVKGFHALVDDEAVLHHDPVVSFMGDGAMLIFGLPEPGPEDACHAVEACVGLCSRMQAWLASLPEHLSSRIGFKIGAHYGVIVASRLGGGSHQHITAIGDTVNVASRLMEVAAAHHAHVALTDELYEAAGAACSVFDSGVLDGTIQTSIRGRVGALPVWLWQARCNGKH
ncbi:CHASE2 domain-containing protein [Microvirga roseola]|uniref:CHASE2 domain-containing protein n=1 Tax=Microvirga roseola TaxID=2883126 RepID=UPI001E4B645C|nr:adenylate/guanylate cyclase domain-containing protein [Microvirga roseola]